MHFIGLEIAAGGTRAVAINLERNRVISRGAASHRWLDELPDGHVEQDPVVWIEAVHHAMRGVLAREWGLPEHAVIGPCSAAPVFSELAAGCVRNGTVAVELGPGASSRVMRQLLADVLGVPVIPVSSEQGAAVAFFRHRGESLGFDEMAGYLVVGDGSLRCDPNLSLRPIYQELMVRQQYLVDTLDPAGFL